MLSSGISSGPRRTRTFPGWKSMWVIPALCNRAVSTASEVASRWRIRDLCGSGNSSRRFSRNSSSGTVPGISQVIRKFSKRNRRFRRSPRAMG